MTARFIGNGSVPQGRDGKEKGQALCFVFPSSRSARAFRRHPDLAPPIGCGCLWRMASYVHFAKRLSRVGDSTLGIEVSRDYDDKEKGEERREKREEKRQSELAHVNAASGVTRWCPSRLSQIPMHGWSTCSTRPSRPIPVRRCPPARGRATRRISG